VLILALKVNFHQGKLPHVNREMSSIPSG
jgi:hypothetical protein